MKTNKNKCCFNCSQPCDDTRWIKPKNAKRRYYCAACVDKIIKEWGSYGKTEKVL